MSYGGNSGNSGGWGAQQGGGNWAPVPGQAQQSGWPDEQQAGGGQAAEVDAASLVIGDGAVIDHDADQTEQNAKDRQWFNIDKPGDYPLVVVGFGKCRKELKQVYVGGQPCQFEAMSVIVRFGDRRDPRYQITDMFILPPSDPQGLRNYNYGSTQPDGSTAGFWAEKFGHFINRLIGGFRKGQPLPPEARTLQKWIGREIEASVKVQAAREDKTQKDPATGKPKVWPARTQIELYSYRACGTIGGGSPQPPQAQFPAMQQGPPPQAQPQAPQTQPLPRGVANI